MAELSNIDINLGTREEDWPDVDVDSDTEEGREAMERAEAAMLATIERSIQRRNQQCASSNTNDDVPEALFAKAESHQDQLTQEERQLLLSRGGLAGKALAYPESLTTEELHKVLLWAPPDVARTNIQSATDGALSTPMELYAKGKDAVDRGQLGAMLNDNEIEVLALGFFDHANFRGGESWTAFGEPGIGKAKELLHKRLGMDFAVLSSGYDALVGEDRGEDEDEFPGITTCSTSAATIAC